MERLAELLNESSLNTVDKVKAAAGLYYVVAGAALKRLSVGEVESARVAGKGMADALLRAYNRGARPLSGRFVDSLEEL
jgi:hypothetical protein